MLKLARRWHGAAAVLATLWTAGSGVTGAAVQLVVDGRPFLMLGGGVLTSSSSNVAGELEERHVQLPAPLGQGGLSAISSCPARGRGPDAGPEHTLG